MIIYVSTLVRYLDHGWLYKIDIAEKRIIRKVRVKSDSGEAKHGGPHGLAISGDHMITGTYSNAITFDKNLKQK